MNEAIYGSILISSSGNICLVQGRSTQKWSFPKGHSNRGESPFQCARRETLEETGIRIPWQTYRPIKLAVGSYYVIFVDNEFPSIVCDLNEIIQVKWVSIRAMKNMRVNVDINAFLRQLNAKYNKESLWQLIDRRCNGEGGYLQKNQECYQECYQVNNEIIRTH
jgi:8-oxo-dGTP pyrophosphatase MutT (NUDIX family)